MSTCLIGALLVLFNVVSYLQYNDVGVLHCLQEPNFPSGAFLNLPVTSHKFSMILVADFSSFFPLFLFSSN